MHRAVFCVVCIFWVVFSLCIFNLSSVLYFPVLTNVNGTGIRQWQREWPKCVGEPLRIYSLARFGKSVK